MDLVFLIGNLLSLALLWLIVGVTYRGLWKTLVVVTPAGEQVVELFADEDPSQEFWLVPIDDGAATDPAPGLRVGLGLTVGSGPACELRVEGPAVVEEHLKIVPYRDWCSIESLTPSHEYTLDGQSVQGHSLLKEGQCLSLGDLSVRLLRRHI